MKLWRLIISFYETVDNNLQHELTNEVLRVEFKLENMYHLWIFKVRNNFNYCKGNCFSYLKYVIVGQNQSFSFHRLIHLKTILKSDAVLTNSKENFAPLVKLIGFFFWHGSACKDDERTSGIWFGMAISNSCHTFHELECKNLFGQ